MDGRHGWARREALKWNVLAVICVFLGTGMAVKYGWWLAVPIAVFVAWVLVIVGRGFEDYLTEALRRQDADRR